MEAPAIQAEIIREVRRQREVSRKDLAEALGVARSTAGRHVDSLVETGLLLETGKDFPGGAGRPRILLRPNPQGGRFVGVDFEAGHLYGVAVDFDQQTLTQRRVNVGRQVKAPAVVTAIRKLIVTLEKDSPGYETLAIGLGVPGLVNPETGMAREYPYIPEWKDIPLAAKIASATGAPVFIENNARTNALAEHWFGEGKGINELVCLTVRTGISAGVITGGRLLTGRHDAAGEIRGWLTPDGNALETVATARTILEDGRYYVDASDDRETAWLRFEDECNAGKVKALALLDRVSAFHGAAAAQLGQLLDPELIFFSGPFARLGDLWMDRVRKSAAERYRNQYLDPPRILASQLGEFCGALGAAALALQLWSPGLRRNF